VRPSSAAKNLHRGRGNPSSIPDLHFPAKFKDILTILIGVLAATKPSQVTSHLDSEDEIDSDSDLDPVSYDAAFNSITLESWEEQTCPSILRNLGDVVSLMGCIYQLRQIADEYQGVASQAQERMAPYDVDPCRQEQYMGFAETGQKRSGQSVSYSSRQKSIDRI
jgi:hypothetical protein